jgi:hypothetical protein
VFDPWPDEPDEPTDPTPESRWGNPERDLPRIPEVETAEADVDPHLFKTFWVSVIFANVALFGVSLGAMLWYFRGQALLGGALVAVGVLAGLRTYATYRTFKTDAPGNAPTVSADGGAESTGAMSADSDDSRTETTDDRAHGAGDGDGGTDANPDSDVEADPATDPGRRNG